MRYFLIANSTLIANGDEEGVFVVEATHYNIYDGWVVFYLGDDKVATSLSPGGHFYFKELSAEEYEDMMESLGQDDTEGSTEYSEQPTEAPSFSEYLRMAREQARPLNKEG